LYVGPFLQVPPLQDFDFPSDRKPITQTIQVTHNGSPVAFKVQAGEPWLAVTPTNGTTPASISVTVDPSGLANGGYSALIVFETPYFVVNEQVHVQVGPPPAPIPSFFRPPPAAPGSLITVYGSNLASSGVQAAAPFPLKLDGASFKVGGVAAPLLYVGPFQANIQVPFEVQPGENSLTFTNGLGSASGGLAILAAAPSFFFVYVPASNTFTPTIVNPDGSLNDRNHPAHPGDYLVMYMEGQGLLDHPVKDGQVAPSTPLIRPILPVTATVGGLNAYVEFAGLAPGFAGLFQVNLQVPDIVSGDQGVVVTVGSYSNSPVPITITSR
jgi:uncharacterized protein (TIGR03437 family)